MTPEARVKAAVKKELERAGAWFFMPVSNGMGRHGIPDFIVCLPPSGKFLAIETKAGKGVPTALQVRELDRIGAAGGTALIINDSDKPVELLREYLEGL